MGATHEHGRHCYWDHLRCGWVCGADRDVPAEEPAPEEPDAPEAPALVAAAP